MHTNPTPVTDADYTGPCPDCGRKNSKAARYCQWCGESLRETIANTPRAECNRDPIHFEGCPSCGWHSYKRNDCPNCGESMP